MIQKMLAALRAVEWADIDFDHYGDAQKYCPCCGAQRRVGHADDCLLGIALSEAQQSKPVLLTDEDLFQKIEIAGIPVQDVALACAIKDLVQSAVLRANGFNDLLPGD